MGRIDVRRGKTPAAFFRNAKHNQPSSVSDQFEWPPADKWIAAFPPVLAILLVPESIQELARTASLRFLPIKQPRSGLNFDQ
jgi:hypothetical protein